jgi:hypothetical protein
MRVAAIGSGQTDHDSSGGSAIAMAAEVVRRIAVKRARAVESAMRCCMGLMS